MFTTCQIVALLKKKTMMQRIKEALNLLWEHILSLVRGKVCEACGKRDKTVCKRLDGFLLEIHDREKQSTWRGLPLSKQPGNLGKEKT